MARIIDCSHAPSFADIPDQAELIWRRGKAHNGREKILLRFATTGKQAKALPYAHVPAACPMQRIPGFCLHV